LTKSALKRVDFGFLWASWPGLSGHFSQKDGIILGLRLVQEGMKLADFRERFGRELVDVYGREIREMVQAGLLEVDRERVWLTARGRLLGNEVFLQFLPESTV
jgi:coproporphyrinogen III oxidase-like Fe-S oxidoreductase